MHNFVKEKYKQFYQSIGFERKGLFELIQKEFKPKTVLYPGCAVHITPSFYFNHVIYVDKSPLSDKFFSDENMVSELINQNKQYTGSAFWKFIPGDFQDNLELRDYSFDMLLSVFSGRLINYCLNYVKPKGLILTNSFFSDNEEVKGKEEFSLIGLVRCRNLNYFLDDKIRKYKSGHSRLRKKNNGFEYIDNEEYYIYQKT